jgi:hypothetical protein
MEQAYADQPPLVIDALDDASVQLELADDSGRERDPAGVQFGKSDRQVAGLAQALQQPMLLGVSERHRRIVAPPPSNEIWGRVERFHAALGLLGVWRQGVWSPSAAAPPRVGSRVVRSWLVAWRGCRGRGPSRGCAHPRGARGVGAVRLS